MGYSDKLTYAPGALTAPLVSAFHQYTKNYGRHAYVRGCCYSEGVS